MNTMICCYYFCHHLTEYAKTPSTMKGPRQAISTLLLLASLGRADTRTVKSTSCRAIAAKYSETRTIHHIKQHKADSIKFLRDYGFTKRVATQIFDLKPALIKTLINGSVSLSNRSTIDRNGRVHFLNSDNRAGTSGVVTVFRGYSIYGTLSSFELMMPKIGVLQPDSKIEDPNVTYFTKDRGYAEEVYTSSENEIPRHLAEESISLANLVVAFEMPTSALYLGEGTGPRRELIADSNMIFSRKPKRSEVTAYLKRHEPSASDSEIVNTINTWSPEIFRFYDMSPFIKQIINIDTGETYSVDEFHRKFRN